MVASKPQSSGSVALSIVVIVYKMRSQAMNTLRSLSASYQQGVAPEDYEVLVVENSSGEQLLAEEVSALGDNFRYLLRDESRPTPVYASNEGFAQARGEHIAFMIDGARMLSPRVVRGTLDALRTYPNALVATPGYHIGEQDQKFSSDNQHDEHHEEELLVSIDWRQNGYRLFDISCFSGANDKGFFHPLMESNCIAFHRRLLDTVGGLHDGYQTPGGGSVNLDFYRQLALQSNTELVILAGEGCFHQYHGGITTMQQDDLEEILRSHREEMKSIRGSYYSAVRKEPIIFGPISSHSLAFMQLSCESGLRRFQRLRKLDERAWNC